MSEQAKIMQRQERREDDVSAETLDWWDDAFAKTDKDGYTPLTDFASLPDGARVLADSKAWAGRFLTDLANPYLAEPPVRRSVHAARGEVSARSPDLLQHELSILVRDKADQPPISIAVRIRESIACLRIDLHRADVPLSSLSEDRRAAMVAWMAEHVLRLRGKHLAPNLEDVGHVWVFQYRSLDEGARFSTAADKDALGMWSWADRMDGGITKGGVYFIGFKRISPTDGKNIWLDPVHWFDGQAWEAYRNPRPRGSP